MTDNDKPLKRLLDAFALGYAEGRQGKPEIPAPQDGPPPSEELPGKWQPPAPHVLDTIINSAFSPKAPVVTTGPRDENGAPEWVNFITEPDDVDPGEAAAAIPRSSVSAAQIQRMRMHDAALKADYSLTPPLATTLAEAWDDGFAAGCDYVSACCGWGGDGEPPPNPHEGDQAGTVEIRAWGRNNAVTVHRGL